MEVLAQIPLVAAHAGHWIASLIYAAPALLLAAALGVSTLRHRRRADAAKRDVDDATS